VIISRKTGWDRVEGVVLRTVPSCTVKIGAFLFSAWDTVAWENCPKAETGWLSYSL
jgi:hypothetical protein